MIERNDGQAWDLENQPLYIAVDVASGGPKSINSIYPVLPLSLGTEYVIILQRAGTSFRFYTYSPQWFLIYLCYLSFLSEYR